MGSKTAKTKAAPLTKEALIAQVHEGRSGSPTKVDTASIVEGVFDAISLALKGGNEVVLPGLGKLRVIDKPARQARNPRTGETIQVPARRALKFSAAKAIKDAVN